MKKQTVAFVTLAALEFSAFAATLEVGTGRPYRTIQSAADVAKPGDVVLIDPGVYREWVKPANAGTEAAPITYRAREKGKTVITGADVVTGWTKRADGRWEVKLPYDAFRGLNPFADFISGNWYYPAKGVRNPRTALFRGNEQMRFREKLDEFGTLHARAEYLVNVAGITVGGREFAGADAAELAGTVKPDFQTKWGREIGFVTPGSTAVYADFPKAREFTLHYSSEFEGRIEFHDGSVRGPSLGAVELQGTDGWRCYVDFPVKLDRAPETGRLAMAFKHRTCYGKRPYVGSYLLRPGMLAGTIVADFKDDPNDGKTELVVRPCCFYPVREGRDYLRLEGLVLRDAGPNWAGPHSEQPALVGTNWSKGWVIEDCEISGSPCAGISLGKHGDEFDNYSDDSQRYTEAIERAIRHGIDKVGHHTVRRCRIRSCDQAGICGSLGAMFSTIEGCDIGYCHWNANFHGCENACIKIHAAVDVLIKGNDLHHAGRYGGIWLDWMAQGTRVTGNFIHDLSIENVTRYDAGIYPIYDAGIFVEVCHGPVIIDNNVILAKRCVSTGGTQSVACIGNVFAGGVYSLGDGRRTPIWEPHSAKLREMLNDCGGGDHRYYNNVMAYAPPTKGKYPNFAADNVVVPLEDWTIAPDGRYSVKNVSKANFKSVDTARLGKSVLGKQAFENRDGTPYVWDREHSPAQKLLVSAPAADAPVTFSSLVDEIVDRDAVTRMPEPAYAVRSWSSYERTSVKPGNDAWFANRDWSNFIRKEGREQVMVDAKGPGAVVRMWCAGVSIAKGLVRIYLDGAPTPVFSGTSFDLMGGSAACGAPFSFVCAVNVGAPEQCGRNLMLPIPYAKSCKITYEPTVPDSRFWYNVETRTYADGVAVETLTPAVFAACSNRLAAAAADLLSDPKDATPAVSLDGTIAPGRILTRSAKDLRGAAVRRLAMRVKGTDVLERIVVEFDFDGRRAISLPLGAFFGTGPWGLSPYRTRLGAVRDSGLLECRLVMPVRSQYELRIVNGTDAPVTIGDSALVVGDYDWQDDRSMHLTANYVRRRGMPSTRSGRDFDMTFDDVRGRGMLVGASVFVGNPSTLKGCPWWGEGDEKIWVDGEGFPSIFGTGTEDYFNYAWSRPEAFSQPFCAQPTGAGNLAPGKSVNIRWRALDAIPFEKSLKFDMEMVHWDKQVAVDYDSVSWRYLRP